MVSKHKYIRPWLSQAAAETRSLRDDYAQIFNKCPIIEFKLDTHEYEFVQETEI